MVFLTEMLFMQKFYALFFFFLLQNFTFLQDSLFNSRSIYIVVGIGCLFESAFPDCFFYSLIVIKVHYYQFLITLNAFKCYLDLVQPHFLLNFSVLYYSDVKSAIVLDMFYFDSF